MSEGTQKITFTRDDLARLKAAYDKEVESGKDRKDTFEFDGNVFVIGYAKYLIEYLEFEFSRE